jgi:hypothetical protein
MVFWADFERDLHHFSNWTRLEGSWGPSLAGERMKNNGNHNLYFSFLLRTPVNKGRLVISQSGSLVRDPFAHESFVSCTCANQRCHSLRIHPPGTNGISPIAYGHSLLSGPGPVACRAKGYDRARFPGSLQADCPKTASWKSGFRKGLRS